MRDQEQSLGCFFVDVILSSGVFFLVFLIMSHQPPGGKGRACFINSAQSVAGEEGLSGSTSPQSVCCQVLGKYPHPDGCLT